MNCSEIAQKFGCHKSTVVRHWKKLNVCRTSKAAHQAELMMKGDVNVALEVQELYRRSEGLLATLEEVLNGNKQLAEIQEFLGRKPLIDAVNDTSKELRNRLSLMKEISQILFNIQAVQEFQREVIEQIKKEDPQVARRIVQRLVKLNTMYEALNPQ